MADWTYVNHLDSIAKSTKEVVTALKTLSQQVAETNKLMVKLVAALENNSGSKDC